MASRDVSDLEVYQVSLLLLKRIYDFLALIPFEHRNVRFQLSKAAESIAALIAEGYAKKKSPKEFCRFLSMALGSSDEVITHLREVLILQGRYPRIPKDEVVSLTEEYKILSKRLNKLHSIWEKFSL